MIKSKVAGKPSRSVRHVVLDSTIISIGKIQGLAPRDLFQGFQAFFHRNFLCKAVANVSVLILDSLNKSEWTLSIMGM